MFQYKPLKREIKKRKKSPGKFQRLLQPFDRFYNQAGEVPVVGSLLRVLLKIAVVTGLVAAGFGALALAVVGSMIVISMFSD